ncbi:MAG: FAD-binding oxidoreductase [Promethearchaeota archaeon]
MSKVKEAYKEIEHIVGEDFISDADFMKAAYSRNVDPAFPDRYADMIVRPENTEEVSEIVKIANKYKVRMVPRGGGADLVGGSVTESGILIDLTRMNQIFEINLADYYCVVGCGITWGSMLSELQKKGMTTGILGPGSGYSATIGGGISNATVGFSSTKYGLVPDICLGVEVVLPNPEGTIIKTGAAASKYATPFCRYGIAPDFTGLFMGDVGTMGIKTKAFLRLFPDPPLKARRYYMLLKDDYNKVFELGHKLRKEVGDGLNDLMVAPLILATLLSMQAENKPQKKSKLTGPVFSVTLEATDQRILDVYLEKTNDIMLKDDVCRPFEWQEVDLDIVASKDWKFTLKEEFNFFQKYISTAPPKSTCTTCHKVAISRLNESVKKGVQFNVTHKDEFPPKNPPYPVFASFLMFLPNGNCVIVGGLGGDNTDENRETTMNIWHKKIRHQVRYGGAHYWLGESISQSIVEADAYTPEFMQFFRDMKKAVDPNYLLSPNKFHMYSYDYDYTKHIVKDE